MLFSGEGDLEAIYEKNQRESELRTPTLKQEVSTHADLTTFNPRCTINFITRIFSYIFLFFRHKSKAKRLIQELSNRSNVKFLPGGEIKIGSKNIGSLLSILKKTFGGSKKTFRSNELLWFELLFDSNLSHFITNTNRPNIDSNDPFYYIGH